MATPRSAMRYRPITGLLTQRVKPVVERRSREASRSADAKSTRYSRVSIQADVQEPEGQEYEEYPRRSRPASRPGRSAQRTPRADVRETRPGDDAFDEEAGWEEEENLSRTRAPRREPISRASTPSRRPQASAARTRRRSLLLWVVAVAILLVAILSYALTWHFHIQGAQDAVSSRFGNHAPTDTLLVGDQVVLARNSGDEITVYFIPMNGGQGNKLVQPLPSSVWGTPALVTPTLSIKGQVLYLQLVGIPTFPSNWAQPEATYRLQNTAQGYQAVQVA